MTLRVSFPTDLTEDITDNDSLHIPPPIEPLLLSTIIVPPIMLPPNRRPSLPLPNVPLLSSPVIDHLPTSISSDRKAIGNVGYTFFIFSPNQRNFQERGCYQGEVIALKSVSNNGKDRRCRYTDGNEEDLHVNDIKCYKSSHYTYYSSC